MNERFGRETDSSINSSYERAFLSNRNRIAEQLFHNPSYRCFDAMNEMSLLTEEYINNSDSSNNHVFLAGGSLGRREMLPNSDIDLFIVNDMHDKNLVYAGVDKFEIGYINKENLKDLVRCSLVDGNRLVDSRLISHDEDLDIQNIILLENTFDRQLANIISEFCYFRNFDYPQKNSISLGPNLKYSSGSSRDTIFFNWIYRAESGVLPSCGNSLNGSELESALHFMSDSYNLRPPFAAIDLILTVKNAAISIYNSNGDIRSKYHSYPNLETIYNLCSDKFRSLGLLDTQQFCKVYGESRLEIEHSVKEYINRFLSKDSIPDDLRAILTISGRSLAKKEYMDYLISATNQSHSATALASWMLVQEDPSSEEIDIIAKNFMNNNLDRIWGGIMAVICSPNINDLTLCLLAEWLYTNEKGAYLLKLISRSPAASLGTKEIAYGYYKQKERMK